MSTSIRFTIDSVTNRSILICDIKCDMCLWTSTKCGKKWIEDLFYTKFIEEEIGIVYWYLDNVCTQLVSVFLSLL